MLPDGNQLTDCAKCKGRNGCCETVEEIPADDILVAEIEKQLYKPTEH